MGDFLQLHFLTAYPPANLNRDDTGRPKTAILGGVPRLRVSSQSLKRAWRTSEIFTGRLSARLGARTQRLGDDLLSHLTSNGMDDKKALETARAIAEIFGKIRSDKDDHPAFIEQLAFISPEERAAAFALADKALAGEAIEPDRDAVLRRTDTAADIAMFGRMFADAPRFNREAAVQVAHAITTHRVLVEDDYYTAVDDLKASADSADSGAGFVGQQEFGAGVFYLYVCVDRALLRANLGGNVPLASDAVAALVEAAAKVGPRGKVASFASHSRAFYVLAEKGPEQPRSLALAFVDPVGGSRLLEGSVGKLDEFRARLAKAYGEAPVTCCMNALAADGPGATLDEIITFATAA